MKFVLNIGRFLRIYLYLNCFSFSVDGALFGMIGITDSSSSIFSSISIELSLSLKCLPLLLSPIMIRLWLGNTLPTDTCSLFRNPRRSDTYCFMTATFFTDRSSIISIALKRSRVRIGNACKNFILRRIISVSISP